MASTQPDDVIRGPGSPPDEEAPMSDGPAPTTPPSAAVSFARSSILLLCVTCLAYCSYFAVRTLTDGPEVVVDLEFRPNPAHVPTEQDRLYADGMVVDVVNASDQPRTILGVREFCSSACYYGSGLPLTVPARGSAPLALRIKVNTPGPISEKVEFYTDSKAVPILTLNVVGDLQEPTQPDVYGEIGPQ